MLIYLSNRFNLNQNQNLFLKKAKVKKEQQIKRLDITHVIFKVSKKSYKKQIKKINEPQPPIKSNVEWWNCKNLILKKEK